jgi:hypothetical protein
MLVAFGKDTVVRAVQPEKLHSPMLVAFGKDAEVRDVQPEKA